MRSTPPEPHSVAGWVLMATSVAIPGVMAVVVAINPYLGWVTPPGLGGPGGRLVVGVVGLALCAAAFGFLLYSRWSWWIAILWGAVSMVEVVRNSIYSPAIISVIVPQMLAVIFVFYVWRRREDFGVAFGGPRP